MDFPGTVCVQGGQCVLPHCTDAVKDADESDLNCGGSSCLPCTDGKDCGGFKDCYSKVCGLADAGADAMTCLAPTCSDHVQNGFETDVDCGGGMMSGCNPCGNGYKCTVPGDCASGVCLPGLPGMSNTCAAPTCTDGVQNGMETGIDCGGPMCTPCADGG
jgi:hypothetical protein